MCEAGTTFMEKLGNKLYNDAQQKSYEQIEQVKKRYNDELMLVFERGVGMFLMKTNVYISGMMKKVGNCDELKQLLVPDPCEEAKLKLKKVDKMDRIIGKMDKIDIGESSKMRKRVSKH
ncbi:hypothetical protein niasHT_009089 [Heterodera trifolii]|uniref:Uncharacterized protein n=1 Tax=Heterodera trifolii TaxID=157864 RepID=A0ABD2M5J2_9BILA